jgi:hypothetical protein
VKICSEREGAHEPFAKIKTGEAPENVVAPSERFLSPMIDRLFAEGNRTTGRAVERRCRDAAKCGRRAPRIVLPVVQAGVRCVRRVRAGPLPPRLRRDC